MTAVEIGSIEQIPPGEGRSFAVQGPHGKFRVAVFRTRGGETYATQAECPHRGGPLADGLVDDHTVICPLHDRIYNLATGIGIGTDCSVRVYPVQVTANGDLTIVV